ncbi:MAG: DM13 domain-containing protein [Thaumarchaeota archaeon]|nr:DM13 domain-containing protein [Nitrososphaerota archaeon]MBI3641576.1 DM13 domain-containing protein [Nitrososphaerota archaeon]
MNKRILIAVIMAAIAIPAGAYAVSPLFINTVIDEPLPTANENQKKAMADHEKAMAEKESIQGNFAGGGGHTVTGMTKIVQLEDGSKVLRLENFKSTNGPDLFVYLSTDTHASDFVSLGALKANNGNQNYNIPEGTDLSKYNTVLIWCKSFSVLFGSSELTK